MVEIQTIVHLYRSSDYSRRGIARKLSMNAMCESLADTLKDAAAENLTHAAVLARLLETELESRSIAAQRRRIRADAFPQLKYLDDLVREDLPAEARAALPELETLEFVRKGRNLVLYGNPGTGKTHKARIINMTGTSYRLRQTQQMIKNQI